MVALALGFSSNLLGGTGLSCSRSMNLMGFRVLCAERVGIDCEINGDRRLADFPSFLPKEVHKIKDPFARTLAQRIQRLPVQVFFRCFISSLFSKEILYIIIAAHFIVSLKCNSAFKLFTRIH